MEGSDASQHGEDTLCRCTCFLDVNSIISQYALDSAISLNSSWSSPKEGFGGGNILGIGGIGRYFDRPTITYSPMTGEKFARKLMNPIPPPALLSLVQTGFPIDLVFRLCIHAINGVQNRFGGGRGYVWQIRSSILCLNG